MTPRMCAGRSTGSTKPARNRLDGHAAEAHHGCRALWYISAMDGSLMLIGLVFGVAAVAGLGFSLYGWWHDAARDDPRRRENSRRV